MDCRRQAPLSMGTLQVSVLEWAATPSSGGALPAQGSDPGLLRHRRVLYHLSRLEPRVQPPEDAAHVQAMAWEPRVQPPEDAAHVQAVGSFPGRRLHGA